MKKQTSILLSGRTSRDILKFRAGLLAEKRIPESEASDFIKVVAFRLADEIYGIELHHIRIVYPIKELTLIPGVPEYISGIINMRGEIISVVNLKKLFDLPVDAASSQRKVIILNSAEMELGVEADGVLGVMQVRTDDIQTALTTLTGIRAQYLKGVTGNGMVILDGEKMLTDESMIIQIEDEK